MNKRKITIITVILLVLALGGYCIFSFLNKESKISLFSIINKTENENNEAKKEEDSNKVDEVDKKENIEESEKEVVEESSEEVTSGEENIENDTGYVSPIDTGSIKGINADKLKEFILGKYPVNFYGAEMLNSSEYYTETGELTLSDGTFILCEFDQDKSGSEVYDIRFTIESDNKDKVKEFLSEMSTVSYEGSEGNKASKWVNDNYNSPSKKSIGNRNFSITNNGIRYTLNID